MSVYSGQPVAATFTTRSSSGASNADSLPTGRLYVNGVANGATVTITNLATGIYKAAVTMPTLSQADNVQIIISLLMSAIADNAVVWRDTCNSTIIGPGVGTSTITVTVQDVSASPIPGAMVTASVAGVPVGTNTTGGGGTCPLYVANGSGISIAVSAPGYNANVTTITVAGTGAVTITLTKISITPSAAGFVTGYSTCYDNAGNVLSGVSYTLAEVVPPGGVGTSFGNQPRRAISASNGLVQFAGMVIGGQFTITRDGGGSARVTAADGGGGTCALPNLLGS